MKGGKNLIPFSLCVCERDLSDSSQEKSVKSSLKNKMIDIWLFYLIGYQTISFNRNNPFC